MTHPEVASVTEASSLLSERTISPVELVERCLSRISSHDEQLQAMVRVFDEEAGESARRAEKEISDGSYRGPLHGVPVAIKDVYDIEGYPTLAGSEVRRGHLANRDSEIVLRLKSAGAIIVGKTVTHEFATGMTSPPARNPWDLTRNPSGSSGGSAAALAADFCLGSTGTDTAGSIRAPASVNGVVGLKPTFGRVSKRGVVPLSWSLDHAGPFAKTAQDAALILETIAGYDPGDNSSLREPTPRYSQQLEGDLRGLKIGVSKDFGLGKIEHFVDQALDRAIRTFKDLGAQVDEVDAPFPDIALAAHSLILASEAAAYHRETIRSMPSRYQRGTRLFLQAGSLIPATDYLMAQQTRHSLRSEISKVFEDYDCLLGATVPTVASPVDKSKVSIAGEWEDITSAYTRLAASSNFLGLPSISVPCGFESSLPLGFQLVAKPLDEATLLRVAHNFQEVTDYHLARPQLG